MIENDIKRIADALENLAELVKGNREASSNMAEALLTLAQQNPAPAEPRKRKAKTEDPAAPVAAPAAETKTVPSKLGDMVEVVYERVPAHLSCKLANAPAEPEAKPAPVAAPSEPVKAEAPAPAPVAAPSEPVKAEAKPARVPSLDEVKFALMSVMQDRGQDAAANIVRKFGVEKARDLKETDYAAVVAMCKGK